MKVLLDFSFVNPDTTETESYGDIVTFFIEGLSKMKQAEPETVTATFIDLDEKKVFKETLSVPEATKIIESHINSMIRNGLFT